MQINANSLLARFDQFLWKGKGDSSNPLKVKRWSRVNYTPTMKKRLGVAAQAIYRIPYGQVIFRMSDFIFSVGNASVVAEKLDQVSVKNRWVYFGHDGTKTVEELAKRFKLGDGTVRISKVTVSQPRKFGYMFKMPLEDLIVFAHVIEPLRPEVSMAIRRAFFDKESNNRCAMAMAIAKIGSQKKIQRQKDANLIRTSVAPLLGFKTKMNKYSFRLYQLTGIAFWRSTNFRAMIGDQMGIGKTVQAIGAIKLAIEDKTIKSPLPVLIVCPNSVMSQWKEAINEWIPGLSVSMMVGSPKSKSLKPKKDSVLITTYETMRRNKAYLLSCGFRMTIFDESHYLKNGASGRTKAGIEIGTKTPYVLLLTGTPMEKGISDLWSQFHIVSPTRFPNPNIFLEKLEQYSMTGKNIWPSQYPTETSIVGDRSGLFDRYNIVTIDKNGGQYHVMKPQISEESDLRSALSCHMIRRLKSEVLDLPSKTRVVLRMPLSASGKRLYKSYEEKAALKIKQNRIDNYIKRIVSKTKQFIGEGFSSQNALKRAKIDSRWLLEKTNSAMDSMLMFMDLKRQIGMLKTAMVITKLTDFIRSTGGREPILVFAEQHRVIDEISNKMSKVKKANGRPVVVRAYTGKQSAKQREQIKKDFMNGKVDILILNKAGNVGLNLQKASYVMFAERYWNPTDEEQAEDRAHRMGKKEPVTVFYIMIPDTIEERILETIDKKRNEIENTVGNQSYNTSIRQQKIASKVLIDQLQKHFNDYVGKVRVPEKEILAALRKAKIRV